jgi:hypothetical protein
VRLLFRTQNEEGSALGFENLQRNVDSMRGVEAGRQAEARLEEEEAQAAAAGIVTGQAALKKRERRQANE